MTRKLRLVGVVLGVATLTLLLLWPLGGPFADATTRQVMMMGNEFGPATLTINVGDRVTWVNHDQVPHDATTTSAPDSFKSPMMEQGDTWMHTFTKPGTYEYYCSIHPNMRAKIIVKAAPEPEPEPEPSKPQTSAPKPEPKPEPSSKAPAPAPEPAPQDDDEPAPDEPTTQAQPSRPRTTTTTAVQTATPTARAAPVAAHPAASSSAHPVAVAPTAAVTTPVTTLNPLLLVAGLVTAVLVFSLLVLSSRPQ
jgi:plastocyanin